MLGQQTVDLDGDRATGECYCLAHHVEVADDGSRSVMIMHIRYQDRYARTADGWKFEHRTLMVDWRETRPARPGSVAGAALRATDGGAERGDELAELRVRGGRGRRGAAGTR